MFAIFKSGGKEYEATPGRIVRLEKIAGEVGESIVLDQVLFFSDGEQVKIGRPTVENIAVHGRIVQHGRLPKIDIFKHKRRKDYRKKQGHRQNFTSVMVESIG